MRYGIRLQLTKGKQEWQKLIEIYDYSRNYLNTANMVFRQPELVYDVKKLINNGIDIILKKEGISRKEWHLFEIEIVSMEEDEIFDYQLYIDLDHDEVGVSKIKFDLERIEVE